MSANGPIIVTTSDAVVAVPDGSALALTSVHGVCFDERLAVAVIEALVSFSGDADATSATVTLWRGPALTGTELQVFQGPNGEVAAGNQAQVSVRFLDAQPPGADVAYSLGAQVAAIGAPGTATVYGFTVTTIPGGVTVLASND